MILYKYRVDNKYTEKLFIDKKVWLSTANKLNDPFECSVQEIMKEFIDNDARTIENAQMMGFFHGAVNAIKRKANFYDLTYTQTDKFLKRFKKITSHEDRYKLVVNFISKRTGNLLSNPREKFDKLDKQINEVGIFSLSENPISQLMWAHYSDESKGLTIGFEVSKGTKLADKDYCLKVNYSNTIPEFKENNGMVVEVSIVNQGQNIQRLGFTDPIFKNIISTKSLEWKYEKEWRYVEPKSGLYDFPSNISEIIFGLKSSKETQKKYINLINENIENKVTFYKIEKIPNSNQIQKVKFKTSN